MSERHILKGENWLAKLLSELAAMDALIACVTRDNLRAPWIHFEAGAVATKMGSGRVYTYLLDLEASSLEGTPLAHYQATVATKGDTWNLVTALNDRLAGKHHATILEGHYRTHWAKLQKTLAATPPVPPPPPPDSPATTAYDREDILSFLETWLAQHPQEDASPPIAYDRLDAELGLLPGSAQEHLERAAISRNYVVERKGARTMKLRPLGTR